MPLSKKKLIFMRHGHAEVPTMGQVDKSRKLTDRGVTEVNTQFDLLKRILKEWTPQKILCSEATRAIQTKDIMTRDELSKVPVELVPAFYNCSPDDLTEIISTQDDAMECIFAIGHNPTWSIAVSLLCGEYISMSPGTFICLESAEEIPWHDCHRRGGWRIVYNHTVG